MDLKELKKLADTLDDNASGILSNVSHVNVAEKPSIVALVMTKYVYSLPVTVRK